jgi:shikimate kinase
MTDRLLLVGMMAVGKTTVGERCAKRLGWTFLDSDAQLKADTGRGAQEIFDTEGDQALRALESRVLAEAIAHRVPVVVAVAGGAVLSPESRELLVRSGVVVWLRASVETMSERVARGGPRPRLGDDPAHSIRDLYLTRRPLYASVASLVIDVDELSAEEVVDRILVGTGLSDEQPAR